MLDLFCFSSPPLNPLTNKARALPLFNPVSSPSGRVFFFSWLSFMLSFAAWYSFPPLLTRTIRADLKLSRFEVLNSNIIALVAGLIMRAITGPMVDHYGPRRVMAALLFCAAIPTGLAGTSTNALGLFFIRFFVGIAGATFVACQAWCTLFFDKNVAGTANGVSAGWGNAGAGITYFLMPAVFDSLVSKQGLRQHVAWRVAFVVPCILLITCGICVLLLCDDTPTGPWATRFEDLARLQAQANQSSIVHDESGRPWGRASFDASSDKKDKSPSSTSSNVSPAVEQVDESASSSQLAAPELVLKPTFKTSMQALFCLQTLMLAAPYSCTFGGELAINSILSSYYLRIDPGLGQTKAGQWAAMFGLLNVITRPAGGFLSDVFYKIAGPKRGVHVKKYFYGFLCFMQGVFCLWLGVLNSTNIVTVIAGIAGMAVFMDAANGAAYGLVPHVNPHVNGLMSGVVGSTGNFGGVIFSIAFRFTGPGYAKGIEIIGIVSMIVGVLITLIPPIPKAQRMAGGYMAS
ncbi:BQ2448_7044 [Microbotryum intermedium]|uniref:Nitrate/nitrite transporter n=1 Tax=Microbotryum intermedium TaxID=269621 RepID=A0A238FJZ6_9BASI|nr:BQ2448_7044 [Microbotryum intermedium]